MSEADDTDKYNAGPSRQELEAEIVRLRSALTEAGVEALHAASETATAQEATRQAHATAADVASDHARDLEVGRSELAGSETLNDALTRANVALAASEERGRAVVESAIDYAIVTTDQDRRITGWNEGASRIFGWSQAEALGRDVRMIWTPEDLEAGVPDAEMTTALKQGTAPDERWHIKRNGSRFWAQGQLTPLRDGARGSFLKILRDCTAQRAADQERERLLTMLGRSQTMVCDWDGRIEVWSQGMERLFGFIAVEAVGAIAWELLRSSYPAPWSEITETLQREGRWIGEVRHRAKDGSSRIVQATWLVHPGQDGAPSSLVVAKEDQTAIRQAEARLSALMQASSEVLYLLSPDWSEMRQLVGGGFLADTSSPNRAWLNEHIPVDEQPLVLAAIADAVRTKSVFELEHRVWRIDGVLGWTHSRAVPLLDQAGQITEWFGAASDVTAQREAENALRESEAQLRAANETLETRVAGRTEELRQAVAALRAEAQERAQAEAQLRQAQKMEALGQLTGGIAHDFNNMLQAIGGSLELMTRRIGQGRTQDAELLAANAQTTVSRAAALTHRLLAFARRQALQPEAVNPDALANGMVDLIRRTVGPSITVELLLHDGNWPVLCDPHQLESVLLNLAINARDAMPDGGRLSIATRHVSLTKVDATHEDVNPGDYVEVSVTDTGTGMDEATKARAFEPFFTTKPVGQGTGLGLSQLYGFVKQSRGFVLLDSAPNQGTTVRLCLPRKEQSQAKVAATGSDQPEAAFQFSDDPGFGSTILLVEDEAEVRTVAAQHLRELGYKVLEAWDGQEALRVLHGSTSVQVDVLVTDVGLPNGLNGRQVAEVARERRPGLPILFITGYAGGALEEQLAPGMAIIGKPFSLNVLAENIRAIIGVKAA